jgi:microtubule-associated protein 1
MKKLLVTLIALGVVLTTSPIFAQAPAEKGAQQPPAKEKVVKKEVKKEEIKSITGEVTAVDTAGKTLTVKSEKEKKEIQISATEKQLKGINKGDKVVVKYVEKEGKLIAKSIKKVKK